YNQDVFATSYLQTRDKETNQNTFDRYAARDDKGELELKGVAGLPFIPKTPGLDGSKVALLLSDPVKDKNGEPIPGTRQSLVDDLKRLQAAGRVDKNVNALSDWWENTASPKEEVDKKPVADAQLFGGRMALMCTAAVPAAMAIGYLLLILYF